MATTAAANYWHSWGPSDDETDPVAGADLKALRLPTFLYDKVARHCAQEGLEVPRLELLDREQRAVDVVKVAKFPVLKS